LCFEEFDLAVVHASQWPVSTMIICRRYSNEMFRKGAREALLEVYIPIMALGTECQAVQYRELGRLLGLVMVNMEATKATFQDFNGRLSRSRLGRSLLGSGAQLTTENDVDSQCQISCRSSASADIDRFWECTFPFRLQTNGNNDSTLEIVHTP
jgi:hypothetical protein